MYLLQIDPGGYISFRFWGVSSPVGSRFLFAGDKTALSAPLRFAGILIPLIRPLNSSSVLAVSMEQTQLFRKKPNFGPVIQLQDCELFPGQTTYLRSMRGWWVDYHLVTSQSGNLLHNAATQRRTETYLTQSFQKVPSMLTGNSSCSVGFWGEEADLQLGNLINCDVDAPGFGRRTGMLISYASQCCEG